jgi:hypothetical protein
MQLNQIKLHLTEEPVVVRGDWIQRPTGYRDWRGQAVCAQPMVGLALMVTCHGIEWVKSDRPIGNAVEVRILLAPPDSVSPDVGVCFGLQCAGPRSRTRWPSSNYLPSITMGNCMTGQFMLISYIEGNPPLELWGLYIVKSDVRGSRNGLWRVRKERAVRMDEPWQLILTYGRAGTIEET